MKNWKQYQQAEPILLRIEQRFSRLQSFQKRYPADQTHLHGFSPEDISHAKEALLESIRTDALLLPGKVYYWLYPFYSGNFLQLVAALGRSGMMDKQKDNPESRNAFYQFFKTVPLDIRLGLGQKLNHPELTQQALRIQAKIKAKKALVKSHLDENFSN
ncbi:MAG: hypothetical protein AAF587_20025 [Bacteroidota bacterium]